MNAKLLVSRAAPLAVSLAAGLGLALGSSKALHGADPSTTQTTATPAPSDSTKDPRAMELLKQSAAKIAGLETFSVRGEATRDVVVRDDFKLQTTMTEDVTVQKPGRMRSELNGDDGRRIFVYDGKTVTVFTSPENHYATIDAPPALEATLDALTSQYDFDLPLTDLLYMANGGDLGENATEAGLVGTSVVGGAECDHLAFRGKKVDWQVWIDKRELLPKKLVITTRKESAAPQYEAILSWNLAPKINEADFSFKPPEGATPMRLLTTQGTATMAATPGTDK